MAEPEKIPVLNMLKIISQISETDLSLPVKEK